MRSTKPKSETLLIHTQATEAATAVTLDMLARTWQEIEY